MLSGLEVDTKRMLKNLDLSGGLIVAEAVMMGLAPHIGRQTAHDVVYDACRTASIQGKKLAEVLYQDETVSGKLDRATIDRLCDPANYLGVAPQMVDRMRAWNKA
jgi:3-carboxy-cis,cis-muconate cycloisomerase